MFAKKKLTSPASLPASARLLPALLACLQVKAPAKREAVFGKYAYSHNFLPHMVEHDIKVNGTKTV